MIKAGGAGSIPDSTPKSWESQPLSHLLHQIGDAVASLNATVVGLDAVENGYPKPPGLNISFSPDDPKAAARKARKFVLEAVLIRVFETLYEHLLTISRLPRFGTIVESWHGKRIKKAEKISDIYGAVLKDSYLVSAAVLTAHWRNRIVHGGSKARLTKSDKRLLQENEDEIAQNYAALSVDCLFCHFEEGKPTLKDVSSLTSMVINLARRTDESLSSTLTQDDFDIWMKHFGLDEMVKKVLAETKPEKHYESVKRVFQYNAPMLFEGYERYYKSVIS